MTTITIGHPASDSATVYIRPAPRLTWRRRWQAWRIAWVWTHGGQDRQIAAFNRRWVARNERERWGAHEVGEVRP